MRNVLVALIACISLGLPMLAAAQGTPIGNEFQVNTYTTGQQHSPAAAFDAMGNFVIVWHSPRDGGSDGIFGQRFMSSGLAIGTEFQVNTYTTGFEGYAAVARNAAGDFTVVWGSGFNQDGSQYGVFGQRFSSAGSQLGTEFQVNTYTTDRQDGAAIAADAAGNFVVAWRSEDGQDGNGSGVFGQRFASNGTPLGTEFQVNTYTTDDQGSYPESVALSPNGFVVVWHSKNQDGSARGVFGQRFDTNGARQGTEFQVNSYTANSQESPAVATDAAGNFVVVWTSGGQDGSDSGVFGQRFSNSGAPIGTEFQVNTYTIGYQSSYPSSTVASDALGNFVVVWASRDQDGNDKGVFGQRFSNAGSRLGTEFQVNTYTTAEQDYPMVASTAAGNFIVTWQSGCREPACVGQQDGSGRGIFAQRFGTAAPATVAPAVSHSVLILLAMGLVLVGGTVVVRRQRRV